MMDEEANEYDTWKAIVKLQHWRSDDKHRQKAITIAGLVVYGLGEAERLHAEHRCGC